MTTELSRSQVNTLVIGLREDLDTNDAYTANVNGSRAIKGLGPSKAGCILNEVGKTALAFVQEQIRPDGTIKLPSKANLFAWIPLAYKWLPRFLGAVKACSATDGK